MKKWIAILMILVPTFLFASERIRIPELYKEFQLEGKLDYSIFEEAYIGYLMIENKNPNVLGIVDYTKPSNQKRFFLLDMQAHKLLKQSYVTHAKNSGLDTAVQFSNRKNSLQNSLGFYLTKNTYNGEYGYSLVLEGLEEEFNSNAEERKIVMHGADFAEESYLETYGFLGRSWGCPAIPMSESKEIIDILKEGHVLFIAGNDEYYKKHSKFLMNRKSVLP